MNSINNTNTFLNGFYAVANHPLTILIFIMVLITAFVYMSKKLNISNTEKDLSEQLWKLLPLILIAFTIILDYFEFTNIAPYLEYIGLQSVGSMLQTIMAIALVINIVAGHWVSISMGDGTLSRSEKKIIWIIIATTLIIQFLILGFGYLAHIRPYLKIHDAVSDVSAIRFMMLVFLLVFNTLISVGAIMLTFLKQELLNISNPRTNIHNTNNPITVNIPVPPAHNPIPNIPNMPNPPRPIISSSGGAISHSSYPF